MWIDPANLHRMRVRTQLDMSRRTCMQTSASRPAPWRTVPRAHAPNRGAVDHHRHHLANLLAVGSRLLNLGGPLAERGGELLVGKFSRDAAASPGIQDLLDVRAPALEGARERAIAELGGGAREQLLR